MSGLVFGWCDGGVGECRSVRAFSEGDGVF